MTIPRSWNVAGVAKCALVLIGLCAISLATRSTAFAQSGTFTLTASLNTARYNHTATLLQNGQVLVTGGLGANSSASLASAELYNPAKKGKWTVTGSMSVGCDHFTATLLQNGEVLVAGGTDFNVNCWNIYNPSTGQWTLTGSMSEPRWLHSATLLPNGEVLVSGGVNSIYSSTDTRGTYLDR